MKSETIVRLLLSVAVLTLQAATLSAQGPKIYISADMEGVAGAVTGEQLGPSGFEYQRFRKFMTAEVNAAIAGARAAGAGEILIGDSHGNGQNLLLEDLPEDVQLVRSWPRPLGMMQGINESFDGAIFIGYHTGTHDTRGVRAHTMSSARLTSVRLNGKPMPEAGINAVIAGHFGVPVIMISGDDAIVEAGRQLLGDVEGAVVKWELGFHSARTLMPQAAFDEIRKAAQRAVSRISEFRPYRLETPIQLDVGFKHYRAAEILDYLSIVERTDAHSIRFSGRDIVEVSKFLQFLSNYEPNIQP